MDGGGGVEGGGAGEVQRNVKQRMQTSSALPLKILTSFALHCVIAQSACSCRKPSRSHSFCVVKMEEGSAASACQTPAASSAAGGGAAEDGSAAKPKARYVGLSPAIVLAGRAIAQI